MSRYANWIGGAPAQHIGNNKYRYETESVGATYICDHSLEHLDLTRFQIWQGNSQYGGVERVELDGYQQKITNGSGDELWVSYWFMLEEGYTNNAQWTVLGQVKAFDSGPACNFDLGLENGGKRLNFVRRNWTEPSGPLVNTVMWTKNDLVQGQWYRVVIRFKPDPTTNSPQGVIQMWFDGELLVNYTGNAGMSFSGGYYWKYGIYRAESGGNNPLAVQYANVEVSKGSLFLRVADPLPIVRILPSCI